MGSVPMPAFPYNLALVFTASFILAAFAVATCRAIAIRVQFVDKPNLNTGNEGGAALGGGVAVVLVIVCGSALLLSDSPMQGVQTAALLGVCAVGLIDDIWRLRPGVKVVGQMACALPFVVYTSVSISMAVAVSLFLVLASNAWNVVDVMDSLLSCVATTCLLGVSIVCQLHGPEADHLSKLASIAAGAVSGFAIWNLHPAKVLLGDAGSLSLGILYGMIAIEAAMISIGLAAAVVFCGLIPFLEVGFLIIERSRKRIPFYATTPDHFALRLLNNNFSVNRITRRVALAGLLFNLAASFLVLSNYDTVAFVGVATVLMLWCVWAHLYLSRLTVRSR